LAQHPPLATRPGDGVVKNGKPYSGNRGADLADLADLRLPAEANYPLALLLS
jgi:hypothetical protein